METKVRIAMLIDADNAPAKHIDTILSDIAEFGVVNIRKAYGNWKSSSLQKWEGCLVDNAIQPIQQFDLTKGKNATDIAMTIDAMDILYSKDVDAFCIVSSDCDFTPLATRLLASGKFVYGYGESKTPEAFVNACSRFSFLDVKPKKTSSTNVKINNKLKSDTKLISLLRDAIERNIDDSGWAKLAPVGSLIANKSSIDVRNYGYSKLGELIKAIDLFETKMIDTHLYIKDKRHKQ